MTGSGKTNAALNLARKMDNFDFFMICAKNPDEPLYRGLKHDLNKIALKKRIPPTDLYYYCDSLEGLPDIHSLDSKKNTLLIIDDMIHESEKSLKLASQYLIASRKYYVSTWFFTQSYFAVHPDLRHNVQHVFIFGTYSPQNLRRMVAEMPSPLDPDTVQQWITRVTESGRFVHIILVKDKNMSPDDMFKINFSEPASSV